MIDTVSGVLARAKRVEFRRRQMSLDLKGERNALVQHDDGDRQVGHNPVLLFGTQRRHRLLSGGDLVIEGRLAVPGNNETVEFHGRGLRFHALARRRLFDPALDHGPAATGVDVFERRDSHVMQRAYRRRSGNDEAAQQHGANRHGDE